MRIKGNSNYTDQLHRGQVVKINITNKCDGRSRCDTLRKTKDHVCSTHSVWDTKPEFNHEDTSDKTKEGDML